MGRGAMPRSRHEMTFPFETDEELFCSTHTIIELNTINKKELTINNAIVWTLYAWLNRLACTDGWRWHYGHLKLTPVAFDRFIRQVSVWRRFQIGFKSSSERWNNSCSQSTEIEIESTYRSEKAFFLDCIWRHCRWMLNALIITGMNCGIIGDQ